MQYEFRIKQGEHSTTNLVDLSDADAAWHETSSVCVDLIRDIAQRLKEEREWPLEVIDHGGAVVHMIRLTTETFPPS